ncbi:MAG: hypothetical protein KBB14_06100 [Thermoanaerobaculia bacterium]|jgi:CBS-domain-containing membrane protein|nr:hypothetical protein [Thermoanaerobaculia bacterium]
MKWVNMYLLGYFILLGGLVAALWKLGVLERVGAGWTAIGLVIAVGIGIMVSVASSSPKEAVGVQK